MNLSTGTVISQLPTGTAIFGNDIFPFTHGITGSATPQTQQASLGLLRVSIVPGYIQENSAQLTYITGSSYRVEAGSMDINGTLITWSNPVTRPSVSLTSGTMNYVYMGASGTFPFLEESTTIPVWDGALNYYKKTGDDTRRCIGLLQALTTNTIRRFLNTVSGRTFEFIYVDGVLTDHAVVSGGTGTTSWFPVPLATFVPVHATHAYMNIRLGGATIGDDGTIGVSPIDLGAGISSIHAPSIVRGRSTGPNNTFFGSAWFQMSVSQTYYYRMTVNSGNPTTIIDAWGARFIR